MVAVTNGRGIIAGDSIDISIDIIAFMGTINELKNKDYELYERVVQAMQELMKEEPSTLDTLKEFAENMIEIVG